MTQLFPNLFFPPSTGNVIQHERDISNSSQLDGNISFLSVIQRLAFYISNKNKITIEGEKNILSVYRQSTMMLITDLKKPKGVIKIVLTQFEDVIDKNLFLTQLEQHKYQEFRDLLDWDSMSNNLSDYMITSKSIDVYADRKGLIVYTSSQLSNSERASKARKMIKHILSEIEPEQREILAKAKNGQKGLKSFVREKITSKDFAEFFNSSEKTFQNRWSELLKNQTQ